MGGVWSGLALLELGKFGNLFKLYTVGVDLFSDTYLNSVTLLNREMV